jgi:acyl dehydratase
VLNLAYVGRSLLATAPVEVTRESIAAFRAALGDTDPGRQDVAPPTFLVSLTLPAASSLADDPDFGLDYSRVLHREQRFEPVRPVRAGDRLSAELIVDSIKSVAGNDILTLRGKVSAQDGPVGTAWTTLFVAGSAS